MPRECFAPCFRGFAAATLDTTADPGDGALAPAAAAVAAAAEEEGGDDDNEDDEADDEPENNWVFPFCFFLRLDAATVYVPLRYTGFDRTRMVDR